MVRFGTNVTACGSTPHLLWRKRGLTSARMFRGGAILLVLLSAHPSLSCHNDGGGDFQDFQDFTTMQQAFSLANIAQGKSTNQSSAAFNGVSSRAVDGNTSGCYGNNTVTHTNFENQPWWIVAFGGPNYIEKVTLWNRTDCCSERLSNFHVDYLDKAKAVIETYEYPGQAATRTEINLSVQDVYFVVVRLHGNNALSLAEVQVWGARTDNLVEMREAENCTAESNCTIAASQPGFTGRGYVNFGGNESWIEWNNIQVLFDGNYALKVRYACGESNRPCAVIVNGENRGCLQFSTTGTWEDWSTDTITVPLVRGRNTIRIMGNRDGGPNVDNMELKYVGNKVIGDDLRELIDSIPSHIEYCKSMFPVDEMNYLVCIKENVGRLCDLVNSCTCD